ncbi:MAG: hypothetical protein ACLGXA_00475, partial [Acidobacteriota bacterium]
MKPSRILGTTALLLFSSILLTTGCGVTFGPTPGPPKPPTSGPPTGPPPTSGGTGPVSISPQYVALSPGQTTQFSATAPGPLTWLVNGIAGGNASVGTVDASGNYTAPASLPQSANVTVTAELTAAPQQDN